MSGDFKFPPASDIPKGTPMYCERIMDGPNVVWFGNLKTAGYEKKTRRTAWLTLIAIIIALLLLVIGCEHGHTLRLGVGHDFNDSRPARVSNSFSSGEDDRYGYGNHHDSSGPTFSSSFDGGEYGDTTSIWAQWEIQFALPTRAAITKEPPMTHHSPTKGIVGPAGPVGAPGPRGNPGLQGEMGATGPSGGNGIVHPTTGDDPVAPPKDPPFFGFSLQKGEFFISRANWKAYVGLTAILLAFGWVVYAWKTARPMAPWKKKECE